MLSPNELHRYEYKPRKYNRERRLHLCIILVTLLFNFLLIIEALAFIVLGAWHLIIPRLQLVLNLSNEIYHRELSFGIILVIIGLFGIVTSVLGFTALLTLRLALLKFFELCLWIMMFIGTSIGITGIIFAAHVDGFMQQANNLNSIQRSYAEEKLMLGMNGGLVLFMSLTLFIGITMVHCLRHDLYLHTNGREHISTI